MRRSFIAKCYCYFREEGAEVAVIAVRLLHCLNLSGRFVNNSDVSRAVICSQNVAANC